jgi:hypothetical protein
MVADWVSTDAGGVTNKREERPVGPPPQDRCAESNQLRCTNKKNQRGITSPTREDNNEYPL